MLYYCYYVDVVYLLFDGVLPGDLMTIPICQF
jgi:hypothetical protein